MADIIHMTAADTVKMLKTTRSQARPSEAAVIAGKREPYHLTYIKKYGNQNRPEPKTADVGENSTYESNSKISGK